MNDFRSLPPPEKLYKKSLLSLKHQKHIATLAWIVKFYIESNPQLIQMFTNKEYIIIIIYYMQSMIMPTRAA